MRKLVASILYSIFTFIFIINIGYSKDSITAEDIVSTFKRSMMHWNVDYDMLEYNKSGAACIPWNVIDKKYISINGSNNIKELGSFSATIRLHRGLVANLSFEVVAEKA